MLNAGHSPATCTSAAYRMSLDMAAAAWSGSWTCSHVSVRCLQIHSDKSGDERDVREVQSVRVWALPKGPVQWAAVLACRDMRRAAAEHRQNLLPKVPGHLLPALKIPGESSLQLFR